MNDRTYVILGSSPKTLAEFTAYLVRQGLEEPEKVVIAATPAQRQELATHLGDHPPPPESVELSPDGPLPMIADDDATVLFLPGNLRDPRPFLEQLRDWMEGNGRALGRIFTVVDCAALSEEAGLHEFYDLCLHFSDVLLLANRETVSKKWIQQYQERIRKKAVPTLVTLLKKDGRVDDVVALLFPEARRLTQFFDPDEPALPPGLEIEGFRTDEEDEIDPRDPQEDTFLARNDDGQYRFRLHLPDGPP